MVKMATWQALMNAILEAGTWTNFGSTPKIVLRNAEDPRKGKNNRIELTNGIEYPQFAFDGSIIISEKNGILDVFCKNVTDRDSVIADIEAILLASSYAFNIKSIGLLDHRNSRKSSFQCMLLA